MATEATPDPDYIPTTSEIKETIQTILPSEDTATQVPVEVAWVSLFVVVVLLFLYHLEIQAYRPTRISLCKRR